MKVIKLTEKQLKETQGDSFTYLSNSDVPSNNGQTEVSVSGKVSDNEYGNPTTTDDIASKITPNSYLRYCNYTTFHTGSMKESINDENNNGIDDFYENDEIDLLDDNDEKNNLMRIPKGVDIKLDELLNKVNETNLGVKGKSMILYKLISKFNLQLLPTSWKKELILKLSQK